MKKVFFGLALSFLLCGGGIFALTACDNTPAAPKVYDMSGVAAQNLEVDYNGQAQTYAVSGQLPEGVTATYKYFSNAERTNQVQSVVDAGTYYVTVSFAGAEGYQPIADMQATLTVNKVAFSNVTVTVKAIDGADPAEDASEEDLAQVKYVAAEADVNGDFYYQFYDESVGFHVQMDPQYVTTSVDSTDADFTKTIQYFADDYQIETVTVPTGEMDEDGVTPLTRTEKVEKVVKKELTYEETRLTNATQKLYLKLTLSDRNHTETVIEKTIYLKKLVVEITNAEELQRVAEDVFNRSLDWRTSVIYRLNAPEKTIDLGGAVWHTISPLSPGGPGAVETFCNENYFCSEFDGNGHTIKNFQLTKDSLKYSVGNREVNNLTTFAGIPVDGKVIAEDRNTQLGFFGYVCGAEIHDLTLENVQTNFSQATEGNGKYLCYGTLVARTEATLPDWAKTTEVDADNENLVHVTKYMESGCSSIYNITIKNSTAWVAGGRVYAGGVIGYEGNQPEYLRKNLNTEDVNITTYAAREHNVDDFPLGFTEEEYKSNAYTCRSSLGGIVGEVQGNAGEVVYEDCNVVGGKLETRYNVLMIYEGAPLPSTNPYLGYQWHKYEIIGGILGTNGRAATGAVLKNCKSSATISFVYTENALNPADFNQTQRYYYAIEENNLVGRGNSVEEGESLVVVDENCEFTGTVQVLEKSSEEEVPMGDISWLYGAEEVEEPAEDTTDDQNTEVGQQAA